MTDHETKIIHMKPHYVDGVPWLSGRPDGEEMAKKSGKDSGMAGAPLNTRIRLIIPEDYGVTKSFFEGFLLTYAREAFEADTSLNLAELVSIDPEVPDQAVQGRFTKSVYNLSSALVSLVEYIKQERLLASYAAA